VRLRRSHSTFTDEPTAATHNQAAEATPAFDVSSRPVVADTAERDIPVRDSSISAVLHDTWWRVEKLAPEEVPGRGEAAARVDSPLGSVRNHAPFTLSLGDQASDATLASALFKPSVDRIDLAGSVDADV
jgi:hypothetical protein